MLKQWHLFGGLPHCRRRLYAADQAAGESTGPLALARDDLARDQRGKVALGALNEATATTGQVVDNLGRADVEPIVVDHVDVGFGAALNDAAVLEPDGPRVIARQPSDGPR